MAQKIVTAVFKLLFPSAADRIQNIHDIAEAIQGLDARSVEGRALPRRLEDAADQIAERLERIETVEMPGLRTGERKLAIEGVERALQDLQPTKDRFIKEALTTEQLRQHLEPIAQRVWGEAGLSESAHAYGRLYLTEAAAYVSSLVRDLPGFDSEVVWQTYIRAKKIDTMLERGISSVVLPRFRPGTSHEVGRFEAGYRSDIISTYKDVDLFGLNLPVELRRHPVDVAYIRLRAGQPFGRDQSIPGRRDNDTKAYPKVDEAIGQLAKTATRGGVGVRLLLTGAAGSGKTTVAQWLAITVSQRKLPETMEALAECLPFVTQLRYAFKGGREPGYEDMIRAAAYRGSDIPGTWIPDCLTGGQTLAVFDGYDELSEHDRVRAAVWIDKLMRLHPRSHFIITSRPDNLDYRWFQRRGFERLELQPIDSAEALECIDRWFDALSSATTSHDKLLQYGRRHAQLLFDFRNRPTVRDLTETPLLCAMLCAFYAHNLSEAAPQSRIELYERVVSALIHLRDYERAVPDDSELSLSFREKILLLQAISKHMTIKSTTTIRIEPLTALASEDIVRVGDPAHLDLHAKTALDLVTEELRGMVTTKVEPRTALNHLLARSVIFQVIGHNQAQFAHRSIQEYLAGGAYGYGDIEALVPLADQPEWRRVIVFAAGAARNEAATTRLVSGLLDIADEARESRRDLLLLVAECLTAAGRVDNEVASRARRLVGEILPPRSRREAQSLSGLGEELLGWLDSHFAEPQHVIASCILAASKVGGPAAMRTISRYATAPCGRYIVPELLEAWDRFDEEAYARQVLLKAPLSDHVVVIRTLAQLRALHYLTHARKIRIDVDANVQDLRFLAELTSVTEIDCRGLSGLKSARGIGGMRYLHRINLSGKERLEDVVDLVDVPDIRELHLSGGKGLGPSVIGNLRGKKTLRVLNLDGCTGLSDFTWLSDLTSLRTLSLNGCSVESLDFCESLSELTTLWARSNSGIRDARMLMSCGKLRRVAMTLSAHPREVLLNLPGTVECVELLGHVYASDFMALQQCSHLRTLASSGVMDLEDVGALAACESLQVVKLPDCFKLASCRGIRGHRSLEILDISRSQITDLDFAEGMTSLRKLYLHGCVRLSDIMMLGSVPTLEYVGMSQVPGVTEDMVDALKSKFSRHLVVEHDPFADPFEIKDYIGA